MDFLKFGNLLSQLLPTLRTKLQLSGLAVTLAFGFLAHYAKPGDNVAMICAGSVGVSLIIFAQLFHFLKDFEPGERAKVFLLSFALFCVFTLALLVLAVTLLRTPPTMAISNPAIPTAIQQAERSMRELQKKSEEAAKKMAASLPKRPQFIKSSAAATDVTDDLGKTLEWHEHEGDEDRSAQYSYSEKDGIATLSAVFAYTTQSREGKYPDADFHEAVKWGSPWLSFDITNPTDSNLLFTRMRTEALSISLINELILQVPNLENATDTSATLRLINEGWGKAIRPHLDIKFARPVSDSQNLIIGHKKFDLEDFDEGIEIDLARSLPSLSDWMTNDCEPGRNCGSDRYLEVFGTLQYQDDANAERTETFKTLVLSSIGGGGNIFPSAAYNITLPYDAKKYPLDFSISSCIASRSADAFIVRLTTARSAHFKLKFTLVSTSNISLERVAEVDILVPRFDYRTLNPDGQFFEGRAGCT
jgi:hypothetical protein